MHAKSLNITKRYSKAVKSKICTRKNVIDLFNVVEFINKHLKIVFLQEYLMGNTEAKLNLFNLLK